MSPLVSFFVLWALQALGMYAAFRFGLWLGERNTVRGIAAHARQLVYAWNPPETIESVDAQQSRRMAEFYVAGGEVFKRAGIK